MVDKKESKYASLFIHKSTRDRFNKIKGRGRTADFYLNLLLDIGEK